MNKTVNINLAGIFFHIDEDAYLKLQRYLEAIKRSFTDSQGRSEIIADIEARIAELFTERIINNKQVIGNKQVDEVIAIMGQPEDYLVDDEIFEDEPQQKSYTKGRSKKLYRDTENSYVGGVSSGLGHYLGIDALWVRLIWIVLIFGFGTGILIYILLWILVPEAKTTSEKILMTGENVTISNIEKKIRDGFESVSESVGPTLQNAGDNLKKGFENASDNLKKIDVNKSTSKIKSSSQTFFDTIADIFMFILKIFAKFIGLILMFVGAVGAIAATVALFISAFGNRNSVNMSPDFLELANSSGIPFFLVALLGFFSFVIPFLLLFYLGLKILITNLKSIGNVAKFTLLGVWLLSIIGLAVVGVRQGLSYKEKAPSITTERFENITKKDTLYLSMRDNEVYADGYYKNFHDYETAFNDNGNKITYSRGVQFRVRSTRDSVAKIKVIKTSRNESFESAKKLANNIIYQYELVGNELLLDNHFIIPNDDIKRNQEVEITIYLPIGTTLFADENTHRFHIRNGLLSKTKEGHFLEVANGKLICNDCDNKDNEDDDDFEIDVNINNEGAKLKINSDGIKAEAKANSIELNEDGVKSKTNNVEVNINEDGIKITSDPDNK
ncbi:phage shock protein C (PspC) family protein [Lacinutrix venerupis]|uniref:PspC domain-containing protein n=1 Tax=Lacinutrix venerupis TaxID=1486034 RepID=UPI000EB42CA3|nr:PspC domain-containing protein [Lacinutrix venerupis]RLJ64476.1 phage shock protein C (PspC) family protein [Lacinutrix venerupis]